MTVTGEPETVEIVVTGQYDVEVEYTKLSMFVVSGASVVLRIMLARIASRI